MKPPIVTEQQVIDWIKTNYGKNAIIAPLAYEKEAQRDADVAYYEPLIEQAKAEVARELEGSLRSALIARSDNCKMYYYPSKPLCPALENIIKQSLKSKYTGGKK